MALVERSPRRSSRSLPRSRASPTHMSTMTTANGAAMMIVMFWMPDSASPSPPPTSSMIAGIAPITAPDHAAAGGVDRAALLERAHHDRRGVGTGDEEDRDEQHRDHAED